MRRKWRERGGRECRYRRLAGRKEDTCSVRRLAAVNIKDRMKQKKEANETSKG